MEIGGGCGVERTPQVTRLWMREVKTQLLLVLMSSKPQEKRKVGSRKQVVGCKVRSREMVKLGFADSMVHWQEQPNEDGRRQRVSK